MMSILFGICLGLSLVATAILSYKKGYSDAMDDFINMSNTIKSYMGNSSQDSEKPDVLNRTDLN
jgi:hypothetical protein